MKQYEISAEREIVTTRVMNVSRAKMFKAWTAPNILEQWWGPAGFTNTFHEYDLRPGGKWRFTIHGPEKGSYENECVFEEIKENELVVWNRLSQPLFRVVVVFEEVDMGSTRVIFRMQFNTQQEADKLRKFVPEKNEENFDKLQKELDKSDHKYFNHAALLSCFKR